MCGITGIINRNNTGISESQIKNMTDIISHRGPDGEGYLIEKNFALGHRRLSIIDLSDAGSQPLYYEDLVIVFNGEIFNYIELREELLELGFTFISDSDTEVILVAFKCWGSDCVIKFNGMWAFVIYDKGKNQLFCSRDRLGIKPFYYIETPENIIFASEIKALLLHQSDRFVNTDVLLPYLIFGVEDIGEETFFRGVKRLLPSHNFIYDLTNNTFEIKQYKSYVHTENIAMTEEEALDTIKKVFEESVKIRLRSDVKVGTCLSGGLDSSMIAGLASLLYKQVTGENFIAIHAKSSERKRDESQFAKLMASFAPIDIFIIEPTTQDFLDCIHKVVSIQEEPFGSPSVIFQYFVFEKAKSLGCTVMLDGQGGDELAFGYERYLVYYAKTLPWHKKIKYLIECSQNTKFSILSLIKLYLYFTFPSIRYIYKRRLCSFIKSQYANPIRLMDWIYNDKTVDMSRLQSMELYQTQLPHLLRYEDKNSMYHSLEARIPMLDFPLVDLVTTIPTKLMLKHGWGKYLLRTLSSDKWTPSKIAWRKSKMGFEAPETTWLSDKMGIMNQIKLSKILTEITDYFPDPLSIDNRLLWRLYNIALWEKAFDVKFEK
jgi:asparagine synthase (glutamine-hydrolysing)